MANEKIEFAWESVVKKVLGDDAGVTGVEIETVGSPGDSRVIEADGAFIFVGLVPTTAVRFECFYANQLLGRYRPSPDHAQDKRGNVADHDYP